MKNEGYADASIKTTNYILHILAKHSNLNNPEQVKQYIANLQKTSTYKQNLVKGYARYTKHYNIVWQKPKYERDTKQPHIPTKEKIEMFIAKAGTLLSLKLNISYRTGMRPVEVVNLKVKDIDFDHNTITPPIVKHGAPRTLKIPEHLKKELQKHIETNKLQLNDRLFKGNEHSYGSNFEEMRNYVANKLNDPSIRKIRLYDLRHYVGTMTQLRYHDVPTTAYQLGHKNWQSTQQYVNLAKLIEMAEDEENYVVKTASTLKEYTDLLEHGFTYVSDYENIKVLRKRK